MKGFFIIFQENRQVGRERFLFYLPQGEGHSAGLLLITLRIYTKKKILENQVLIVLLLSRPLFRKEATKAEFHPTC